MQTTIQIGQWNTLTVARLVTIGAYLEDGADGILLPKRFMPTQIQPGQEIRVFIYHDGEGRPIATTQKPLGVAGDIVKLRVVSTTDQGAFMDLGLMKDLFIPISAQRQRMRTGGDYIVKIIIDEQTGRLTATEKIEPYLNNELLTVKEQETVQLLIYRRTDIGYVAIINNLHTGVIHFSDIFRDIMEGMSMQGYVKKIYPDHKIDLGLGKSGYQRVEDETDTILNLLRDAGGFLPYHDKSDPETIYSIFGMSKKTFKMSLGKLYKERKIKLEPEGIRAIT